MIGTKCELAPAEREDVLAILMPSPQDPASSATTNTPQPGPIPKDGPSDVPPILPPKPQTIDDTPSKKGKSRRGDDAPSVVSKAPAPAEEDKAPKRPGLIKSISLRRRARVSKGAPSAVVKNAYKEKLDNMAQYSSSPPEGDHPIPNAISSLTEIPRLRFDVSQAEDSSEGLKVQTSRTSRGKEVQKEQEVGEGKTLQRSMSDSDLQDREKEGKEEKPAPERARHGSKKRESVPAPKGKSTSLRDKKLKKRSLKKGKEAEEKGKDTSPSKEEDKDKEEARKDRKRKSYQKESNSCWSDGSRASDSAVDVVTQSSPTNKPEFTKSSFHTGSQ